MKVDKKDIHEAIDRDKRGRKDKQGNKPKDSKSRGTKTKRGR